MKFTKSELTEMINKNTCKKAPRYLVIRELLKNQEIVRQLKNRYDLLLWELEMIEKKYPWMDTHIIEYRIEELEKVLGLR